MENQRGGEHRLGPRPVRQLSRLAASRDNWQRRCREKQERIRAMEVRVRDLEQSRDRWKQRALQSNQEPLSGE